MNILLTGGTGLIGSALVKKWQKQHQLQVLSRTPQKVQALFGPDVTAVANVADVDFNQLDAVVNLAGEPIVGKRWTAQQKQRLCHSRWDLTAQLVNAINTASTRPGILISGSAIGFYGAQQQQLISEEFNDSTNEFSHQLCQRWEEIASAVKSPTRLCILRTGIVLAKTGGALQKMLPPFKLGLGGRIGTGQQYMSWIHIDDMVALIDFLLQHPTLQGVFNATAPHPVTNTEFSQTLAQLLHRPALLPMPALVLQCLLGEAADLLLTGQRVLPTNATKAGFSFQYDKLQPALAELLN